MPVSSLTSRAGVAVGTLAVSALVAVLATPVPATATVPAGITREAVLGIAGQLRSQNGSMNDTTRGLVSKMATSVCGVTSGEVVEEVSARATASGDDADGLLVVTGIKTRSGVRTCDFAAIAVTDAGRTLSGTATTTGAMASAPGAKPTPKTITDPLSGPVAVTTPLDGTFGGLVPRSTSFSTAGSAVRTTTVPSSQTVLVQRTAAEVAAAKKSYGKKVKAATKVLDKAPKRKKAAAKKAFKAKKAAALAAYRKAVAPVRVVRPTTTTSTDSRPFSLATSYTRF